MKNLLKIGYIILFVMMFISPLVVHPRKRKAVILALALVRGACALIELAPVEKLAGHVFRQVVEKPLKADASLEAVSDDFVAVCRYSFEMTNDVHVVNSLFTHKYTTFCLILQPQNADLLRNLWLARNFFKRFNIKFCKSVDETAKK